MSMVFILNSVGVKEIKLAAMQKIKEVGLNKFPV